MVAEVSGYLPLSTPPSDQESGKTLLLFAAEVRKKTVFLCLYVSRCGHLSSAH